MLVFMGTYNFNVNGDPGESSVLVTWKILKSKNILNSIKMMLPFFQAMRGRDLAADLMIENLDAKIESEYY